MAQRCLEPSSNSKAPFVIGDDDHDDSRGTVRVSSARSGRLHAHRNARAVFSPGLGVDYIDSMNVMTGGYSAEYGNRFGGILDVVTKSGFTVKNRGSLTLGTDPPSDTMWGSSWEATPVGPVIT
jgi:outer membrane receptor for ferrienterochelin and colicin